MKNQDRSTKVLLSLLVVGVWGLLLRPLVNTSPVVAQTATNPAPKKQYEMAVLVSATYKMTAEDEAFLKSVEGKKPSTLSGEEQIRALQLTEKTMTGKRIVQIGGTGTLYLNGTQVAQAVSLAGKSGWELHSVVAAGTDNNYMVIFEK